MPVVNCGRAGCRFPIKLDRIFCRACFAAFHPECSNLCPEEYATRCSGGDWHCPVCTSATTSNVECVECGSGDVTGQSADTASAPHPLPIAYVTSSSNKLRETMQILGDEYAGMLMRVDVDLPECQGSSPEEIARLKCQHAVRIVGRPALVEDTCLAFDALNGLPGPYIKWFLEAIGPEGLRKMVEGFGTTSEGEVCDGASAICTFAYASGVEGEAVELFQGVTRGRIVAPRGRGSFGWDCCFEPLEAAEGQTYAEMSAEAKNAVSHRSKAVSKLRQLLDRLRSSHCTAAS